MKCIYHSRDLDGYCSAAIVKRKYPSAEFIGYDYGQPFPWEKIGDETVVMVDVSLPMEDMRKLSELCGGKLTWIDHHVSAINEFMALSEPFFINPVLQDGIAACEGAWQYFFSDEKMPHVVNFLGEYDTWRNADQARWEDVVLPFQYGMRLRCNSLETFPMDLLEDSFSRIPFSSTGFSFSRDIEFIIENGTTILDYQKQQNEVACRAAFEAEIDGLRAICLNGGGFSSQAFESVYDEAKHDLMVPFRFDGKQWAFSLYTTKDTVDCSQIAKARGGGGHKKAAGFQTQNLETVLLNAKVVV